MENEDIMRIDEIEETENLDEIEETPKHSGLATVGAMAIGSGLTLGGIALAKKLKKVWADRKAKKEAEENPEIVEAEVVEIKTTTPKTGETKAAQSEK